MRWTGRYDGDAEAHTLCFMAIRNLQLGNSGGNRSSLLQASEVYGWAVGAHLQGMRGTLREDFVFTTSQKPFQTNGLDI